MSKETLTVRNWPIKEADLDLRKVTVFIGEQASGKSCLAKLLAILRSSDLIEEKDKNGRTTEIDLKAIRERLAFYKIDEFFDDETFVEYQCSDYSIKVADRFFQIKFNSVFLSDLINDIAEAKRIDISLSRRGIRAFRGNDFEKSAYISSERQVTHSKLIGLQDSLSKITFETDYIPTERSSVAFGGAWYETDYISAFIDDFSTIKKLKKRFDISPLNIGFEFNSKSKENQVRISNEKILPLSIASNGVQSIVPIAVSVETANPILKHFFIIEEPELNLYPTTQKKLVEYLIEKCTKGDNRLVITTHSPYILTALNNCIEAANVRKSNPEAAAEVDKLVPRESQIDFEDVAAYFVGGGTARSIMNHENQLIDANALDEISEEIGQTFDRAFGPQISKPKLKMTCLETLRKAFPKASNDCFDQKLAVEEKGRKFRIELKKGSNETFCRAKIDGCAINDETVEKCDSLFLRCKTNDLLFVELKGKDVKKGFSQLISTILQTKPHFNFQNKQVHGFIVSSRVPNGTDVQNMKADFRKNYGQRLEVKNGILVEKFD